jgi:hypothetical protein
VIEIYAKLISEEMDISGVFVANCRNGTTPAEPGQCRTGKVPYLYCYLGQFPWL